MGYYGSKKECGQFYLVRSLKKDFIKMVSFKLVLQKVWQLVDNNRVGIPGKGCNRSRGMSKRIAQDCSRAPQTYSGYRGGWEARGDSLIEEDIMCHHEGLVPIL